MNRFKGRRNTTECRIQSIAPEKLLSICLWKAQYAAISESIFEQRDFSCSLGKAPLLLKVKEFSWMQICSLFSLFLSLITCVYIYTHTPYYSRNSDNGNIFVQLEQFLRNIIQSFVKINALRLLKFYFKIINTPLKHFRETIVFTEGWGRGGSGAENK